ncbi:LytTR family DNA-binding domain-containing protein [Saccharibacillus sp. CPCC 101409]|uniref:LytR/AlgR family response regulator transcription factor n=1 Tax=Saccharibacillus sp. CPCC 101409 TaxID=3058041 RepID=UPI00267224BD|nr:LytTR family DNA-binding domain-containing protein [Saccharibacillus sp. CPCC 101409]MDO3409390.1 LytTR family DNA-binding domain-containing protein [Saccharibacillus sp. CPCC 101409]
MTGIIVEDEFLAMQELDYLIGKNSSVQIVGKFEDGIDVLKFLQSRDVDVIFLDINIPSLDGVLLAKSISKFAHKPYIVFTTAYKEHAAEAFEIEAFDYILKPYHEPRIAAMLSKLETAFAAKKEREQGGAAANPSTGSYPAPAAPPGTAGNAAQGGGAQDLSAGRRVNLYKGDKIIVVDADDIYYASAQEKTTLVYTRKEEYTMHMSISDFQAGLPQDKFFRCHRSYTVNLSKIREIVPWFNNTYLLRLRDVSAEVPVSRSKVKEFRQLMRI